MNEKQIERFLSALESIAKTLEDIQINVEEIEELARIIIDKKEAEVLDNN